MGAVPGPICVFGLIWPTICAVDGSQTMFNSGSWLEVVSSLLEKAAEIEDPVEGFRTMPLLYCPPAPFRLSSQSLTAGVMSTMMYWFFELGVGYETVTPVASVRVTPKELWLV